MTRALCLLRHKWSPEMPVTHLPSTLAELGNWAYRVCQRCGRDWAYPKSQARVD